MFLVFSGQKYPVNGTLEQNKGGLGFFQYFFLRFLISKNAIELSVLGQTCRLNELLIASQSTQSLIIYFLLNDCCCTINNSNREKNIINISRCQSYCKTYVTNIIQEHLFNLLDVQYMYFEWIALLRFCYM